MAFRMSAMWIARNGDMAGMRLIESTAPSLRRQSCPDSPRCFSGILQTLRQHMPTHYQEDRLAAFQNDTSIAIDYSSAGPDTQTGRAVDDKLFLLTGEDQRRQAGPQ